MRLFSLKLCLELLDLVDIPLIDLHELSIGLIVNELDRIAEFVLLMVQLLG